MLTEPEVFICIAVVELATDPLFTSILTSPFNVPFVTAPTLMPAVPPLTVPLLTTEIATVLLPFAAIPNLPALMTAAEPAIMETVPGPTP